MNGYEIWLDDPTGRRVALIDNVNSLTAQKITHNSAGFKMVIPPDYDALMRSDGIIEVWHELPTGSLALFNAYFIRAWEFSYDKKPVTTVWGLDGVSLLARRIIPYPAASTYCAKTDFIDDMMKEIVRENFSSAATDADRRLASLLQIDPDVGLAPSISKRFAYRNVLEVLRDLSDNSRTAGTLLYFDCMPAIKSDGTLAFRFLTKINQLGADHAASNQVIFGTEWGNLENSRLTFDYRDSASVVYAGGQGLEDERVVEEREDAVLSKSTPWGRNEVFYNCSGQAETVPAVQAAGDARLAELRPRLSFSGTLVDTPAARFGLHWNFGDRVTIISREYQFSAYIKSVELQLTADGHSTANAGFELL